MGGIMSYVKIFLFLLTLLSFNKCYALLISHIIPINNQLSYSHSFTFDLVSRGYNPATDVINWVTFSYDIREIEEDEAEEFVTIFDHFLYWRGIFPDMNTGIVTDRLEWIPQETCRYGEYIDGEEVCYFKPDQDGFFYSYWNVSTDNLWMNSISLTIDVVRTHRVDEPSSILLLAGVLFLLLARSRHAGITAVQCPTH